MRKLLRCPCHRRSLPPHTARRSTAEVQQLVRVCAAHEVPIIPYGQGTSVEGHIQAHKGGISISVSEGTPACSPPVWVIPGVYFVRSRLCAYACLQTAQMNEVVQLNAADMDCRVQVGGTVLSVAAAVYPF
jgi:FAD/FMN-containing dehydrogenase